MIKLAGKILDPYDDPAFVGNPRVAEIGLPDAKEVANLPDRDFGLIVKTASGTHRRYPLSTSVLTKLSAAYFNAYGNQLPSDAQDSVRALIKQAADRFGLTLEGAVAQPSEVTGGRTFVSVGPEVTMDEGLDKQAAHRLAQDEFIANYGRMTPAERAMAANHLHKVAEVSDPRIRDYVSKSTYGPLLADGIDQRVAILKEATDQTKLATLHALVSKIRHMDPARGAVMLHQFDKTAGIGNRAIDAFRTCWGGFEKQAAATNRDTVNRQFGVGKLDPMAYKIETLARGHGEDVRKVFSEEIAAAFLRDPIGFYTSASGQVRQTLKSLAGAVGEKNPDSEIHKGYAEDAKRNIRAGEYTAWSKTCG